MFNDYNLVSSWILFHKKYTEFKKIPISISILNFRIFGTATYDTFIIQNMKQKKIDIAYDTEVPGSIPKRSSSSYTQNNDCCVYSIFFFTFLLRLSHKIVK